MRRCDLVPAVVRAIKDRKPLASARYWLCWKDGEIVCMGSDIKRIPEIRFAVLTPRDCIDGLPAMMWQAIESNVAIFLRQKGIV